MKHAGDQIRREKAEVLVIGSGGAGLRAAIELFDNGIDVLVVGKCRKRDAHTVLATGGINAALGNMDPKDTWQLHAADTIRDGGHINDPVAVKMLCRNAPHAVKELSRWGARFHRERDGRITQRFFGAATYRRACFAGDHTGKEILNVLVDQAEKRGIRFKSEAYIFSLLMSGGRINGAVGLDIRTGEIICFHSKMVILATGGHSRMFTRSSSRFWENNGDGISLAYGCKARFMDMEMFQFHPTGMIYPPEADGLLVTEAVRGEGGILTNTKGERFMAKYDPARMELSARDVVSRAIYTEIQEGRGTPRGGVWLDISHRPKSYILKRLPEMYRQFQEYMKIDISREKMEVAPTAHYSMGGIFVNHANGKTGVANLFAVGEVTAGVHGANRLGGNSLAEIMVFGRLLGETVARAAGKTKWLAVDEKHVREKISWLSGLMDVRGGRDPIQVKKDIQKIMWENAGVVRNAEGLKKALRELESLGRIPLATGRGMKMNERLIAALDINNMMPTCRMIVESALFRKESRGAHYRSDYPKTNSKWRKNIICIPVGKNFKLATKPVQMPPKEILAFLKMEKASAHLLE